MSFEPIEETSDDDTRYGDRVMAVLVVVLVLIAVVLWMVSG